MLGCACLEWVVRVSYFSKGGVVKKQYLGLLSPEVPEPEYRSFDRPSFLEYGIRTPTDADRVIICIMLIMSIILLLLIIQMI